MRDLTHAPIVSSGTVVTAGTARAAALTAAEYSIRDGWENELGEVLDAMGIR